LNAIIWCSCTQYRQLYQDQGVDFKASGLQYGQYISRKGCQTNYSGENRPFCCSSHAPRPAISLGWRRCFDNAIEAAVHEIRDSERIARVADSPWHPHTPPFSSPSCRLSSVTEPCADFPNCHKIDKSFALPNPSVDTHRETRPKRRVSLSTCLCAHIRPLFARIVVRDQKA